MKEEEKVSMKIGFFKIKASTKTKKLQNTSISSRGVTFTSLCGSVFCGSTTCLSGICCFFFANLSTALEKLLSKGTFSLLVSF